MRKVNTKIKGVTIMGVIFETVKSCLTNLNIHFTLNESNDLFSFSLKTDYGSINAKIFIEEEKEWFVAIVFFPNGIPTKFIDKLYPVINKLNRESIFESWNVDPEDGQLGVRWGATVDNGAINERMVQVIICYTLKAVNSKYEEIMTAIYK